MEHLLADADRQLLSYESVSDVATKRVSLFLRSAVSRDSRRAAHRRGGHNLQRGGRRRFFMVCILLLLTTYSFSRTHHLFLTIDPNSVAMPAGGGGGDGAHVQLEDVGDIGGSSVPAGETTETAQDARP